MSRQLPPLLAPAAGMTPAASKALRAMVGAMGERRAAGADVYPVLVPLSVPGPVILMEFPPEAVARAIVTAAAAAALYRHDHPTEVAVLSDAYVSLTAFADVGDAGVLPPSQDPRARECIMVTYAHRAGRHAWAIDVPYSFDDRGRFTWHKAERWVPALSPMGSAVQVGCGALEVSDVPPDDALAALGVVLPWREGT